MNTTLFDNHLRSDNQFDEYIRLAGSCPLEALEIDTIQVNVGLLCNLKCEHCHVVAGPGRKELMSWETMQQVLDAAIRTRARMIDITGGAPEMVPHFREFVLALRTHGFAVQVRTNLTILFQSGFEGMAEFMAAQKVGLVASLPCYLEENVDAQRGSGVFRDSIQVLQNLNSLGYGIREELPLTLVYNPLGPSLPPDQTDLEPQYRHHLAEEYGIQFTRLIAIANMPIGRFWAKLKHQKQDKAYFHLLKDAYNPKTVDGLMCRHLISVDWEGNIHDCDFNLALGIPVNHGAPNHVRGFDPHVLVKRRIQTGNHCFGCTAGCGSSCGGELTSK
jgi:radical SAM/Cys-rich protein